MFRAEDELVAWLQEGSTKSSGRLRIGIGDDAAVVRVAPDKELILTTDLSIEGVHFLPRLHPPRAVGHRALARSLSDVAAMGGTPRFALVSLAVSHGTTRAWIQGLYAGLFALARRHQVTVIGGDTAVVSGQTLIDVILVGEMLRGAALLRSGARPGDHVFISGRLGLSALGLAWLRTPKRPRGRGISESVRAHLAPQPQCDLGRYLARRQIASAAIDVSDGLSTDLHRLVRASGVGARIWADLIPTPEPSSPRALGLSPLELALHGGEDYQLLFTVPPGKTARLPRRHRGAQLHRIGEITRARQVSLIYPSGKTQPLRPAGYDHFRKARSRELA